MERDRYRGEVCRPLSIVYNHRRLQNANASRRVVSRNRHGTDHRLALSIQEASMVVLGRHHRGQHTATESLGV